MSVASQTGVVDVVDRLARRRRRRGRTRRSSRVPTVRTATRLGRRSTPMAVRSGHVDRRGVGGRPRGHGSAKPAQSRRRRAAVDVPQGRPGRPTSARASGGGPADARPAAGDQDARSRFTEAAGGSSATVGRLVRAVTASEVSARLGRVVASAEPGSPARTRRRAIRSAGRGRAGGPAGSAQRRGFDLVPVGEHRVGDAPVAADGRVVPGHAQLVLGVVVAVDQVPERQVGERGEPVGHARAG